ncbi:MAG: hypothetical protein HMLIMOIP_002722 [Candidatus Nitrosomirales archaeon]|jgi:hypothetical protein
MITIDGISNGDVLYETPADLELTGLALYKASDESIVNCPDGVKLTDAAYKGTWIVSDVMPSPPETVEIVFKPQDDTETTIIFSSTDGSASYGPTGSIVGYTCYLNGTLVTDLSDLKYGQWNHLVLIDSTPSATEFYLNSDDGLPSGTDITYMLLTAYPETLDEPEIVTLYKILLGTDLLSQSESASINEGVFPGGQSFNSYSYTWAILGAGGT